MDTPLNWRQWLRQWFIPRHNQDIKGARFRIGQRVVWGDAIFVIDAIRYVEVGNIEYEVVLQGVDQLINEDDLMPAYR